MRLHRLSKNASGFYARREQARKGFTLMELIVVIAILGIMAAVLLTVLNPLAQVRKARDAGRKTALKQIQNALEQYYNDKGSYPATPCFSGAACWTDGSFLGLSYLPSPPQDPIQSGTVCTVSSSYGYYYYTVDSGKTYQLITRLENTSDPFTLSAQQANCYWSSPNGFNYKVVSQQQ